MSQQLNVRLPKLAHDQIAEISEIYGLTKTQTIILAVDRLARALQEENTEAARDARRLRTVARIAPHLDLGQEE